MTRSLVRSSDFIMEVELAFYLSNSTENPLDVYFLKEVPDEEIEKNSVFIGTNNYTILEFRTLALGKHRFQNVEGIEAIFVTEELSNHGELYAIEKDSDLDVSGSGDLFLRFVIYSSIIAIKH